MNKKWIATIVLAGSMIAGIGVVGAQDTEPTLEDTASERGGRFGGGPRGGGGGGDVLTDLTGLEHDAIREALADGSTIADLLDEAGVTVDDFVAASLAQVEARLDEAVANGRIDEDAAAQRLADAEERLTALANGEMELGDGEGRGGRGFGPRGGEGDGEGRGPRVRFGGGEDAEVQPDV